MEMEKRFEADCKFYGDYCMHEKFEYFISPERK